VTRWLPAGAARAGAHGWRHLFRLAAVLLALALTGCAATQGTGYLAQATWGHLSMLRQARPVEAWLSDTTAPAALRERLALSQRIRDFAVREAALPDNRSYRRYADLGRPFVVWNVVAAPELSLELKTSCFPVVGCVGYRGYFSQELAQAWAEDLRRAGDEVAVYGVPAYSTLGRLDWLGGDPLLNTFIGLPQGELARLIFHELAHQRVYVRDDTTFNESFATAVERLAVRRWLETQADDTARAEYERLDHLREQFLALTRGYRERLDALYRSDADDDAKRAAKARLMQALRRDYEQLQRTKWNGFAGYDRWMSQVNNALLATQAAYTRLVPGFERLFEQEGEDFERFYAAVERLAREPRAQRHTLLECPARIPCAGTMTGQAVP